jgi:dihydrofolate reductase
MSDTGTGTGKVVVHRAMSLDGFIAGPGHAMDWVFGYVAPDEFPEIIAATGAILAGRRTYEVGRRDASAGKASGEAYGGAWSGPQFVLTHQPPENPEGPAVTFLSGDIEAAVATARKAADGKNLEIFGADVTTARRRHTLLFPRSGENRPGTDQHHTLGVRHHAPLPGTQ